ncbi:MAG: HAD family hydrolase [Marinilabiliaceae bacterium]
MTQKKKWLPQNIKAVLFDMDGVLYDSMKHHADTWVGAFQKYGIDFPAREAYANEGRTGGGTIQKAIREIEGREATEEETEGIYREKTRLMADVQPAKIIPGMQETIRDIRSSGKKIIVVTGSRQPTLLERLNNDFGVEPHEVVSGKDVKIGKPHAEPYLIGLEKARCNANESLVVENAPLGIESAVNAGIFTVAINTGPLEKELLSSSGADLVFENPDDLRDFLLKAIHPNAPS